MDGQSYKTRADIAADIDVLEYRAEKLEAEAKQLRQQIAQLEQAAADLGNRNLSERQIARYPVVKSASERQKDAAVSLAVWEATR